jgi:NADPH:quinone reductase-like Zn-dependent oxidoreductase
MRSGRPCASRNATAIGNSTGIRRFAAITAAVPFRKGRWSVTGIYPALNLPRVPGHEVVGCMETLSSGVSKWKIARRSVSASSAE